ncbi:MAG TPA: SdrD B-like domain-containing protein, partial [Lacipirellulaceae bacterium]|nr:SdrD B-like domain-containing protein [Lacipirellulaceae bacterium]
MLRHRLSGWGYSCVVVGLLAACASNALAAHIPGQSQLGGWVYIDRNNDGQLAFSGDSNPEYVIGGVVINLYKVVGGVQQPAPYEATTTDDFGRYVFDNIDPGTYNMYEMQPVEYVDGKDTLGSLIQLGSTPIPPGDS